MSAITPQSDLKLLKCPIESDNRNQLTFENATKQRQYFNSLPKLEVFNFTYQRKDSIIRYPAHIDSILTYNYVMYQNDAYTDKWFYAFITKMEYVNDNMTYITIKTDVYQTWQFDMVWKASFIEREHVNNDNVGVHTVPEKLETGEYICNSSGKLFDGNSTYICIAVSDAPDEVSPRTNKYFNGIFSGTEQFLFDQNQAATNFIKAMAGDGKMDAIVAVYLTPQKLFTGLSLSWSKIDVTRGNHTYSFRTARVPVSATSTLMHTSTSFTVPNALDGYVPKNNKLKTYPYSYFYVTNNAGSDVPFRYEEFVDNTAQFKTLGSLTPGGSIRCIPINYKKLADESATYYSFNGGITVAKYPICSWANDAYTNWLTQNSVNLGIKQVGGAVGIVAGAALIATGVGVVSGLGLVGSGIGMIADSAREVYNHSLTPDQAQGNSNSGDVVFSSSKMEIRVYKMSLRREYAIIIDQYFSMYGYKINQVALPHITGRENWNYVKTIGANIEGNIPEEDLNEIKSIFNNGVTLWHKASTYLDYTQDNAIV